MEEMYVMGREIHYFGVVVLMGMVVFNIAMLGLSNQIVDYARRMRIAMPISATMITLVLFTGAVMMAAKHLAFTLPNVAMIVIGIVMIALEVQRYTTLKRRTDVRDPNALSLYKAKAFPMLGVQAVLLLAMTGWMMVL